MGLFLNYQIATGVYLFTKPERIVWHIIFAILTITFLTGFYKLGVNTYRSFSKVFFGSIEVAAGSLSGKPTNSK